MTPQEKAEELLSKYYLQVQTLEQQKKCALIAVDEIIKSSPHSPSIPLELMPHFKALKFWQEVKKELEKL